MCLPWASAVCCFFAREMASCGLCHAALGEDDWWRCPECQAVRCTLCNDEERAHEHSMVLVRGVALDRFLFRTHDPLTGNNVFLGNYACALPGSATIRDNGIKWVVLARRRPGSSPLLTGRTATIRVPRRWGLLLLCRG